MSGIEEAGNSIGYGIVAFALLSTAALGLMWLKANTWDRWIEYREKRRIDKLRRYE